MKSRMAVILIVFIGWLGGWSPAGNLNTVYSTGGRGHNPQAITNNNFGPQVYRYQGTYDRTYIVWPTSGNGSTLSLENMVCYYDHETGEMSDSVSVGYGTQYGQDIHGKGVIIVDANGYVIVAHEQLYGTGAVAHPSEMLIKRTTAPEDITTWETAATIATVGAYPHLWEYAGILYLGYRAATSYKFAMAYSSNGEDWTLNYVMDSENFLLYAGRFWQRDAQGIHVFINLYYGAGPSYPICGYMYSADGVNWRNIDGSYEWDASSVTVGKIDWLANCVVEEAEDYDDTRNIMCGGLTPGGGVYLVQADTDSGSSDIYWYLRWWEGAAWQKRQITGAVAESGSLIYQIMPHSDTVMEALVNKSVGGTTELQRWATFDKGLNWEKVEDITTGSSLSHYYITGQENSLSARDMIVAASYATDAAYCDIRLARVKKINPSWYRGRGRLHARNFAARPWWDR